MANERVAKVFHAARQDIEIVFARPGWCRARLRHADRRHGLRLRRVISYVNLVKKVTGVDLDKILALHRLEPAPAFL